MVLYTCGRSNSNIVSNNPSIFNRTLSFLRRQTTEDWIKIPPGVSFPFILSNDEKSTCLVDDRLAGEGTGKVLGINDPILFWVVVSVFTAVWSSYFLSTRELGGDEDENGISEIWRQF